MNPRKIESLEELRHAKRVLQLKQEVTKREFAHSLGTTRDNLGSFLVKNVALPIGGAFVASKGMGAVLGKLGNQKGHTSVHRLDDQNIVIQQAPVRAAAKSATWLTLATQMLRIAVKYRQTGNGLLASLFGHKAPQPEANAEAMVAAPPQPREAVVIRPDAVRQRAYDPTV